MTEEQDKLAELVALSEKAQPGPWKASDTYDAAYIMAPDLVGKRANILVGLWPVHAERDTESAERITYATTEFVTELVNWFRANQASLRAEREPATEAVLEDKPVAWLIIRPYGTGKAKGEDREVVLSPLTDATFMDEGDQAWPLYRALKGKGASQWDGEFVRVPREPTMAMRRAGAEWIEIRAANESPYTTDRIMRAGDTYRAMVAASADEQKG